MRSDLSSSASRHPWPPAVWNSRIFSSNSAMPVGTLSRDLIGRVWIMRISQRRSSSRLFRPLSMILTTRRHTSNPLNLSADLNMTSADPFRTCPRNPHS